MAQWEPDRHELYASGKLISGAITSVSKPGLRGFVDLQCKEMPENPAGCWITLSAADLLHIGAGIYYFQVLKLPVVRARGEAIEGHIQSIFDNGAHPVLLIQKESGGEILVPYVDEFVEVDLKASLVIIKELHSFDMNDEN